MLHNNIGLGSRSYDNGRWFRIVRRCGISGFIVVAIGANDTGAKRRRSNWLHATLASALGARYFMFRIILLGKSDHLKQQWTDSTEFLIGAPPQTRLRTSITCSLT